MKVGGDCEGDEDTCHWKCEGGIVFFVHNERGLPGKSTETGVVVVEVDGVRSETAREPPMMVGHVPRGDDSSNFYLRWLEA